MSKWGVNYNDSHLACKYRYQNWGKESSFRVVSYQMTTRPQLASRSADEVSIQVTSDLIEKSLSLRAPLDFVNPHSMHVNELVNTVAGQFAAIAGITDTAERHARIGF